MTTFWKTGVKVIYPYKAILNLWFGYFFLLIMLNNFVIKKIAPIYLELFSINQLVTERLMHFHNWVLV